MLPRQISGSYHVLPQITPEDVAVLKEAGIKTVICNRPDGENPPELASCEVRAAVEAEGLAFFDLPFDHSTLTLDIASQQRALVDAAEGPILAYCATGNRCTIVWALGEAQSGTMGADEIIAKGAEAGYDLRGIQQTIENLISQR